MKPAPGPFQLQMHRSRPCLQYIMEDIFFSGTPLLESVGDREPPVVELRETMRHAISMALIPMRAYARQYEQYLDLMNIDIEKYVEYAQRFSTSAASSSRKWSLL